MRTVRRVSIIAAAVLLVSGAQAFAAGPLGPLNDLAALGAGTGQTPDAVPVQTPPAPSITPATPAPTSCAAGGKPQPGPDGRVPAGSATNGLYCNITMLSHQGTSGGFKVYRYTDTAGHTCAFYDTALLFPLNAFNLNSSGIGVVVLDMSDPSKPMQTDTLTEPAMLSPHESLNLNTKRGLLAAVDGNPGTYPGYVSIYDASKDCRHPVLDYSGLLARFGHESGFSPDGKTFYAAGTAVDEITAIDVTDPKNPHDLSVINEYSHGLSLSDDGNRAYIADATDRYMLILDVSQIQARKDNPQAKEISRITWPSVSIPQNAIPFTENGHPYILEFDEYNASTLSEGADPNQVGAGRIIDIADEKAPKVIANLRLAIDNPEDHQKYGDDPGADGEIRGGAQGYAAHYCNIPTRVNPKIVACSFIASGLRVFDISDLTAPKEIGYFVAPTQAKAENGGTASDFSMSMPAFDSAKHQIWFTDGTSGFYALKVADSVWPSSAPAKPVIPVKCASAREFTIHLQHRIRHATVYVDGKRVTVRKGFRLTAVVNLRGKGKKVVTVRIVGRTASGKTVHQTRRYRTCRPGH